MWEACLPQMLPHTRSIWLALLFIKKQILSLFQAILARSSGRDFVKLMLHKFTTNVHWSIWLPTRFPNITVSSQDVYFTKWVTRNLKLVINNYIQYRTNYFVKLKIHKVKQMLSTIPTIGCLVSTYIYYTSKNSIYQ